MSLVLRFFIFFVGFLLFLVLLVFVYYRGRRNLWVGKFIGYIGVYYIRRDCKYYYVFFVIFGIVFGDYYIKSSFGDIVCSIYLKVVLFC